MLKKLYAESLPYNKNNMQLLNKMMIVEENPQFTIMAKTSLAMRTDPQQGWHVGYVEKKDISGSLQLISRLEKMR